MKRISKCIVSILLINSNLLSCNRTICSWYYFECVIDFFIWSTCFTVFDINTTWLFMTFTWTIMIQSNTILLYITRRPWQIQKSHQTQWCPINLSTRLLMYITCFITSSTCFSKSDFFETHYDFLQTVWGASRDHLGCF